MTAHYSIDIETSSASEVRYRNMAWGAVAILMALVFLSEGTTQEYPEHYNYGRMWNKNLPNVMQYIAAKEYIQHIHSMIDAYKNEMNGQMMIETNAMIDTKYRTWKRNADLINSLLALPKEMNDAGR